MAKSKIDILNERLKDVVDRYDALKRCGMDEEILTIYLQAKTRMSKKQIKLLLENVDKFYDGLRKKLIVEEI